MSEYSPSATLLASCKKENEILRSNVVDLQMQLQSAWKRIAELREETDASRSNNPERG